jgi:hypothetical protein
MFIFFQIKIIISLKLILRLVATRAITTHHQAPRCGSRSPRIAAAAAAAA